jgi:hypothetical protein
MSQHKQNIRTPYGTIHYGPECKDDYGNMVTYDSGGGHTILTLQRPAMKSLWAAQVRYAKRSGWSAKRLEREPKGRPILVLPGTNRTCATQLRLWRSDSSRYAHPDVTGHTRGLALDLTMAQANFQTVVRCLKAEGWEWCRPDDEPWHCSYFVSI